MDPLGFGFENFNAIGRWRSHDGKHSIDASGVLPDGSKFIGPRELRQVLPGKGGGTIRPGRHIVYPRNTPLNSLWVRLLDCMGVKGDQFGDRTGHLKGQEG